MSFALGFGAGLATGVNTRLLEERKRRDETLKRRWEEYLKTIPELQATIDAKATWTVGKGYTADPITTLILDRINGWGKDTFNTILENIIRTYNIGGD